jgi:hypothetical protein
VEPQTTHKELYDKNDCFFGSAFGFIGLIIDGGDNGFVEHV